MNFEDIRVLRELDEIERDDRLSIFSLSVAIERNEADCRKMRERIIKLRTRLKRQRYEAEALYWERLIRWATTGKIL